MAGGTAGDESWGFWFRHHLLRYGYATLGLFIDVMAAGELLQLSPRPLMWYAFLGLVTMLAGLVVLEIVLYRRLFPGQVREGFNPPPR